MDARYYRGACGVKRETNAVPDLEKMDEQEATRLLNELTSALSPEAEYRIRHPEDYLMEMPQLGERFRGREKVRAFQESFTEHSAPPRIRIRRVLVGEGVVDYGVGKVAHGVSILELKDGRVWRDRRYFAEPFEAPEWRAHFRTPYIRSSHETYTTKLGEVSPEDFATVLEF